MNEFSAAIGLTQLNKLNKMNKIRTNTAKKYHERIKLEHKMPIKNGCAYHFYWIIVKNRDAFREKMLKKGIETGTHYKPIHKFSMYKQKKKLPITEKIGRKIVTLPTHPNLKDKDIDFIIKYVNEFN